MVYVPGTTTDPFPYLFNHRAASDDPDVMTFIEWLEAQFNESPKGFRTNFDEIFRSLMLSVDDPRRGKHKADDPLSSSEKTKVRQLIARVKDFLDRCYSEEEQDIPLSTVSAYIDCPPDRGKRPRKGRILFVITGSKPLPFQEREASQTRAQLRNQILIESTPAREMWNRMLAGVTRGGLLVYSNEQPHLAREFQAKLAGKFSGSGEVAAAFMVGGCLACRAISFTTTPSLPLDASMFSTRDKLLDKWQCLIFLGGPSSNSVLSQVLNQEGWKRSQSVHFDVYGKKTILFEGPPGTKNKKRIGSPTDIVDYALISFLRNETTGQILISMAGSRTVGTHGAAMVLCDDEWVAGFIEKTGLGKLTPLPNFEAVVRIDIARGTPKGWDLVRFLPH